jgi:hypothetical protein
MGANSGSCASVLVSAYVRAVAHASAKGGKRADPQPTRLCLVSTIHCGGAHSGRHVGSMDRQLVSQPLEKP